MSIHNLCFGSEIRKIIIPMHTQFFYIKVGLKGVYFSWTCFPNDVANKYIRKSCP